jgi:glycosyltransferase involved in cell wall biosynthesis
MTKLHILVVNDFGTVNGGAGKVALTSAYALAQHGFSVTVLCAVPPVLPETPHPNLRFVCTGQQEIRTDPQRLRAACTGIWNLQAKNTMDQLLGDCDPASTVVHAHGWTKALSSSVLYAAIARNFPVVVTLHEYFLACPNGGFFDYQKGEVCHRKPLSLNCILTHCDSTNYAQKLWRIGRQFAQKHCAEVPGGLRYFISISDLSEKIIAPHLPAARTIFRVPNPIDACKAPPVRVEHNRDLLYVGRIAPEKGILSMLHAARAVGMSVTLVGDGAWRERFEKAAVGAVFTGWLSPDQVRSRLHQARALIFPSLWNETQGLVVMEAAALGVPSVVSDRTAAREFVAGGAPGLCFEGGNEADLAAKLSLLQDDEVIRRMGEAAYNKYWANPFTMNSHISLLDHCYKQILADTRAIAAAQSSGIVI